MEPNTDNSDHAEAWVQTNYCDCCGQPMEIDAIPFNGMYICHECDDEYYEPFYCNLD